MANYPKKMMDPTEAALSAIEEALNIRDDDNQRDGIEDRDADSLPPPVSAEERRRAAPALPTFEDTFGSNDDVGTARRRHACSSGGQ